MGESRTDANPGQTTAFFGEGDSFTASRHSHPYGLIMLIGYAHRMRSHGLILLLLLLLVFPYSCGSSENPQPLIEGDFVVRFDPIEGGCWGLVATDNTLYSPINLDNAYRVNGLRVHASILPRSEMGGFCPGAIVQVLEITPAP